MKNSIKAALVVGLVLAGSQVRAEDTRKKWQLGGGISYWSTIDDIRSNSTTAYAPQDDTTGGTLPAIVFPDPRPDANELNQPTIQDGWKLDLNASFGFTRWFSLQLGASYYKGPVGNIEFYSEDRHVPIITLQPTTISPQDGSADCSVDQCLAMTTGAGSLTYRNAFLPVGELTEVPLQITGMVRFRPESPFDPYLGGGVGYIFTGLDTSQSSMGTPLAMTASNYTGNNRDVVMQNFDDVSSFTNGLIISSIQSGARGIRTFPDPDHLLEDLALIEQFGGAPITGLTAEVNDAPEVHLMGGFDYYFTSHLSLYVDGRYLWARSKVEVRIDGQNQMLGIVKDYGCVARAPSCSILDGEVINTSNNVITNPTLDDTNDVLLIQGGDIRLGGFSLGVGFKYTF